MASRPVTAEQEKAELAKINAFKLHEAEIETQDEWDEILGREGLFVIDVYQAWCGPCKAMFGIFKKVKNLLSDPLLFFAIAKTEEIESLKKYRGKSQPCFLFYAGGQLVAVIRGIDAPLLRKTIEEQLQLEKKAMEGLTERQEIVDPGIESEPRQNDEGEDDESESEDGGENEEEEEGKEKEETEEEGKEKEEKEEENEEKEEKNMEKENENLINEDNPTKTSVDE